MNIIPITKYKPYEHIPLSREIVLRSLQPAAHHTAAAHVISKVTTVKRNAVTKHIRPVLIFGELEWLVMNMTH